MSDCSVIANRAGDYLLGVSLASCPLRRRWRCRQIAKAVPPAKNAAIQGQRRRGGDFSTCSRCRRVLSVAGSPEKWIWSLSIFAYRAIILPIEGESGR